MNDKGYEKAKIKIWKIKNNKRILLILSVLIVAGKTHVLFFLN